jgi:branched-chain amino acid transport system substrate-binding protein
VIAGRLFVASLFSAVLLAACAGPSGPTQEEIDAAKAKVNANAASARAAAAEDNRIVIGLAGPMTGDLQQYGMEMRRGAELAVADLNAAGGVLGRKVTLEVADDHCGKQEAEDAAKELVQKGVVFVDGHFCSGSTLKGSEVYAPADVLQITSVTNGLVTDISAQRKVTTLLRVAGRDEMQGYFAAEWLAKAHAGQPIVVLSDNSAYGAGIARYLLARLKELGVEPAVTGEFAQGQSSYGTLLKKLKEVRPTAIYVAAYQDDIGRLTWSLRTAKIDAEVVGPDTLSSPEFWSFSQMSGNGVRYSNPAPTVERPEAADLVARLRADGGREPGNETLNSYAAIQVFAAAAEATKGVDAKAISDYLRQNSVKTVLGDLQWDAKGDLTHADYIWYVWQDGLAVRQ